MSNFEDWEGGWMGVLFVSAMKSEFEPRSTDRKFWKENVHREIYRSFSKSTVYNTKILTSHYKKYEGKIRVKSG